MKPMGVDTYLYLLNHRRYTDEIKPILDKLLDGSDINPARLAFDESLKILHQASTSREHPWTPFHQPRSHNVEESLALLNGHVPPAYFGDRRSLGLMDPDEVTTDPILVREYNLRDSICSVIVEGLCVPWHLDFPPIHAVTKLLGNLSEHSKRFEHALCGEMYQRCCKVPYDIFHGDDLVDTDLIAELATEIARIAPPDSKLWQIESYRNLYLLLHHSTHNKGFQILAAAI